MRRPVVVGVAGGVGTSTVAAALGGQDTGVHRRGYGVDVVVCRTTVSSIELAHAVVNDLHARASVVLAVVSDGPDKTPRIARAMLRMLGPYLNAVVDIPWVPHWRRERHPVDQAARALRGGPPSITRFARAIDRVADAVGRAEPSNPAVAAYWEPSERAAYGVHEVLPDAPAPGAPPPRPPAPATGLYARTADPDETQIVPPQIYGRRSSW